MSLFTSDYNYLGINLGTSSVKLVELTSGVGSFKLSTYGFTDRSIDISKDDSESAKNEMVKIIKKLYKESGASSTKVVTALPTFSVFSSVISLPKMDKKDLAGAVRWEAKKIIPMPIEDVVLDWHIIGDKSDKDMASKKQKPVNVIEGENNNAKSEEGGASNDVNTVNDEKKKAVKKTGDIKGVDGDDVKVILTAAPKMLVNKYIDIFKRANLNLLSLETEAFSLIRSLVGNDKSTMMIVDMGDKVTNISIVRNGVAVVNRSVELGGRNITGEISRNLNVSPERADQFKRDIGINAEGQSESSVFKSIESTITPIVEEVQYTIDFFKEHCVATLGIEGCSFIEKIILTGGSSLLNFFPEYLSGKLNKKAYIGDPFARVIYPDELRPIFEEVGPRLSVAAGLAMREMD